MDYAEEQAQELEALEAILMDDLQEFDGTRPDGWDSSCACYSVAISPADDGAVSPAADDAAALQAEIIFAHTPRYPEDPPLVKARSLKGLSDADIAALQRLVDDQVAENLGMAMIYTIIAAAQEWLRDKAAEGKAPVVDPAEAKKAAQEAEERRLAEIRALGTPVAPDTFNVWKEQFYAETTLARTRLEEESRTARRLTGKQWFLQQAAARPDGRDEASSDGGSEAGSADDEEDDTDFDDDEDDDEVLAQLEQQLAAGR